MSKSRHCLIEWRLLLQTTPHHPLRPSPPFHHQNSRFSPPRPPPNITAPSPRLPISPPLGSTSTTTPLWSETNKNRDVSTGPLAHPFAFSLAPLTRSLAPDCSLRLRPPLRLLVHSLAHFAHSLALFFFSIFDHSAMIFLTFD